MRRLALVLLGSALFCGCSASIPRHPAAYITPTEPPALPTPIDRPTGTPGPTADTSAWVTLAPAGEGFSVLMPGPARAATQTIKTQAGNANITTWTFTDASNRAFSVSRAKFARNAFQGATTKTVLDGATTAITSGVTGAQISRQADITLGQYSGRSLAFASSTTSVECEFFKVGDSVYSIAVGYAPGQGDSALTSAFFGSFQLTV